MAYGTLKCDNITFTNGGIDQTITVSGIVQSISGDITATGTIQGAAIIGTSTVSGATVTGTTANFVTVSGTTVTGTTANFGGVITAPTIRGTTTVSGATVTGTAGQFTTITGSSAGFTTVTGATVTGTTANFATLSGTTITGGHVTTASGTYTGNVTAAAFVPTGSSVPTNGVYLPSANNVAISTNGNGALFIDENGKFGIGTANPEAMLDITPEGVSTAVLIRNSSSNFSAIGFRRYADTSSYTAITANAELSGYLGIIAGGFEKTRIDNSGSLLVGISSPRTNFFNGTVRTTLQVENAGSGSGFISSVRNINNTLGPGIVLGKSRGATLGTNTVVGSGDAIGTLSFQGADGTNFVEAAAIAAAVDGTPGANDMPGRLVFSTTADGSSSPTERLRITSDGKLGLGTSSPDALLTVNGVGAHGLGSAAAPSFAFTGDLNTGLYSPGADQVAISTNGTGRLFIDSNGNVGVGIATPVAVSSYKVQHLRGGTTTNGGMIRLDTSDGSVAGRLYAGTSIILDDAESTSDIFVKTNGANSLLFGTSNTERLRITSDGKLGLGTSVPQAQLQVLDTIKISNSTQAQGNLILGDGGSTAFNVGIARWNGGTNAAGAGGIGYFAQGSGNVGGHFFYTGDAAAGSQTERMRISATGAVGIGTTSPQTNLEASQSTGTRIRSTYTSTAGGRNGGFDIYGDGGIKTTLTYAGNEGVTHLEYGLNGIAFDRASSEKLRLDGSGRLLVGTSSYSSSRPDAAIFLDSTSTTAGFGNISLGYNGTAAGNQNVITFYRTRGTSAGATTIVNNGDSLGEIRFNGADGIDALSQAATIGAEVDGTPGANDMPGRLVFSTTADGASSPTEKMVIRNNGQTYWGSSAPSSSSFGFSINRNGATGLFEGYRNSNGGGVVFEMGGNAGVAYIKGDGDLENTNNSYGAISDASFKENIVDANEQWNDIKALQVRKYNFKPETGYNTHTQIGLIAQEVELVSPGLVSESPDRDEEGNDLGTVTKSVNYSVLYMKAVKALQEAMERIETLEAKVAALGA